MNFSDAELVALESGNHNIGVFFRLDVLPEPIRLWLGFGDIKPGADVFDPDGALYRGLGELKDVPAVSQLLNGAAERVNFTVSGVSERLLGIAGGDDSDVIKGRPVTLGFALMDDRFRLIGGVHWCAYYIGDYIETSQTEADGDGNIINTIALSCSTRFTGRRRPSFAYFSNHDQQARFAGDLFCSLTTNYAHGYNKTWPVF